MLLFGILFVVLLTVLFVILFVILFWVLFMILFIILFVILFIILFIIPDLLFLTLTGWSLCDWMSDKQGKALNTSQFSVVCLSIASARVAARTSACRISSESP